MANIISGLPNDDDVLIGTQGNDIIRGQSGNDWIRAGLGDDIVVGGRGSDVVVGGLGADRFEFSAGHVTNSAIDYVADFDLRQGDTLRFADSGPSSTIEVLSVTRSFLTETEFNGIDLRNDVAKGTDITFTVKNSAGEIQTVVLLDAFSGELASQWDAYLATLGLSFTASV